MLAGMNWTQGQPARIAAVVLGTGLGVGMVPKAPGTFGTLWGLPLTWAILQLPGLAWQLGTVAVLCAVGVPICGAAARRLGHKDPGSVVWDELAALPIVFLGRTIPDLSRPTIVVTGFLLFRALDISKLPPGRQLERLPGGWGIMADDIAAAVYSWLLLNLLIWLLPSL
jgi:phosphatidylglycerophosphatase A